MKTNMKFGIGALLTAMLLLSMALVSAVGAKQNQEQGDVGTLALQYTEPVNQYLGPRPQAYTEYFPVTVGANRIKVDLLVTNFDSGDYGKIRLRLYSPNNQEVAIDTLYPLENWLNIDYTGSLTPGNWYIIVSVDDLGSNTINVAGNIILWSLLLIPVSKAQLEEFSEKNAYEHIRVLSEEIGHRIAGSENGIKTSKYIEIKLNEYKLNVYNQEFEFKTIFNETEDWTKHKGEKRTGRNIIGILKGTSEKKIIISAHYDSVNGPGANDDASGVGVMLELARILAIEKHNKTIIFIAFDAEEHQLAGSKYYVANLVQKDIDNILGVINLDSVGRGDFLVGFVWESDSIFTGYSSPMDFVKPIYTGNDVSPGTLEQLEAFMFGKYYAYLISDHSSFIDDRVYKETGKIIPSVSFTFIKKGKLEVTLPSTAASHIPDLHSVNDTVDKIEIQNLKEVGEVVLSAVNRLDMLDNIKKEPEISLFFKIGSRVFSLPYWSILLIIILVPLFISVFLYVKDQSAFALFFAALPYIMLNFIQSQDFYSNVQITVPIFIMITSMFFLFGMFHSNKRVKKISAITFLFLLLIGSLPSWEEFKLDIIGYQMELMVVMFVIILTVLSVWEYAEAYTRRYLKWVKEALSLL